MTDHHSSPSTNWPLVSEPGLAPRRRAAQRLATGMAVAVWGAPLLTWATTPTPAGPAALMLTPEQTEGPFYPADALRDEDADLLRFGDKVYDKGVALALSGTVRDVRGAPVADAVVEIWQCDEAGHYRHPRGGPVDDAFQGFGRVSVDAQGRYAFRTIRPSPYVGRTPHIHVKVRRGARELLTTQLYVAGLASNERDGLYRRLSMPERAALTVAFEVDRQSGGQRAQFGIVVRV